VKTDDAGLVGVHAFEAAGLGKAPFRFVGVSESSCTYPDGTTQATGTCDYCSNGIRYCCHIRSADGKEFVVGSDCVRKTGDTGLIKAYKCSPEARAYQRKLAAARKAKKMEACRKELAPYWKEIDKLCAKRNHALSKIPHSLGFYDRVTGKAYSVLDEAEWLKNNQPLHKVMVTNLHAYLRKVLRLDSPASEAIVP
jgi:hypothetical protein